MTRTGLALCVAAIATAAAAASGAAPHPIRPKDSSVTFVVHRPGERVDGTAHEFSGEVQFDPADLSAGGSVVLKVMAVSLETGNGMRDKKMKGSHLEAEKYPEIVFRSTSVRMGEALPQRATGGGAAATPQPEEERGPLPCPPPSGGDRRALVEGTLALHGVERSILVPVAIRYDNDSLTAEGCVNLTYTDYKIPIPRFLWLVMDDDIQVRFRLVAGRP